MDKIKSILFVCTGNSCRSIMAEGLMKKYLKELGKDYIEVRSAGISALAGFPPTQETIDVMKQENVDVSSFYSKKATEDLIKNSDVILVMEKMHKDFIDKIAPEAASRTYLLREFQASRDKARLGNHNIPDPIGKPMDYYKLSFQLIKEQIERIAKLL